MVLGLVTTLAYDGLLDGRGQTVGKLVLGLRVVDEETGAPIGPGRGLTRAAMPATFQLATVLVPFTLVLSLLDGLAALRDEHRRTWHDRLVGSVVVREASGR